MATRQGPLLGYHIPEQVSNQEPLDSRPCVLTRTTTLLTLPACSFLGETLSSLCLSSPICLCVRVCNSSRRRRRGRTIVVSFLSIMIVPSILSCYARETESYPLAEYLPFLKIIKASSVCSFCDTPFIGCGSSRALTHMLG